MFRPPRAVWDQGRGSDTRNVAWNSHGRNSVKPRTSGHSVTSWIVLDMSDFSCSGPESDITAARHQRPSLQPVPTRSALD
ncbi:hypothetical protein MTO96_050188 [Rhipicephalus appendiculatus]